MAKASSVPFSLRFFPFTKIVQAEFFFALAA